VKPSNLVIFLTNKKYWVLIKVIIYFKNLLQTCKLQIMVCKLNSYYNTGGDWTWTRVRALI